MRYSSLATEKKYANTFIAITSCLHKRVATESICTYIHTYGARARQRESSFESERAGNVQRVDMYKLCHVV